MKYNLRPQLASMNPQKIINEYRYFASELSVPIVYRNMAKVEPIYGAHSELPGFSLFNRDTMLPFGFKCCVPYEVYHNNPKPRMTIFECEMKSGTIVDCKSHGDFVMRYCDEQFPPPNFSHYDATAYYEKTVNLVDDYYDEDGQYNDPSPNYDSLDTNFDNIIINDNINLDDNDDSDDQNNSDD